MEYVHLQVDVNTLPIIVCKGCGSYVNNKPLHEEFHAKLTRTSLYASMLAPRARAMSGSYE